MNYNWKKNQLKRKINLWKIKINKTQITKLNVN